MITGSRFSPNQTTPAIALEAKPGLIRKENSPPLIRRPVDMLMCPPQTFPSLSFQLLLFVNSASEPIPIDDTYNKTDKENESSEIEDKISYDPLETIEEIPAVVEELPQPSANFTCRDRETVRQIKEMPISIGGF
ncbi:hypothetical protein AVEN_152203-1 [Araneus ventricosus]|uniref:Uncharacterized protein n=1 Tax=Araneus ventricosus TaxID=182803 RepID=A0A4Y2HL81_ARAVE|nr:hypothetical protein AVEN_152203-1 [Araneus ventricosus]